MGWNRSNSTTNSETSSNNSGFSDIRDSSINSIQGLKIANNAGGGKVGSGGDAITNFSILDGGAIKDSFEFADSALGLVSKANSQAYDFASDISSTTASQIGDAITKVSESARSETENILISLQKYALYGALIWGAVQVFRSFKGGS